MIINTIVRGQSPLEAQFWCVAGICAGIGLFVYGFRLLQRRRLILDTPFSKIRSAALGMVEISGLAVGPYTMIAPITARACYYYRTLVWEWRQNGKNKQWVKIAGECMHVPFFVDDNTGRMLVVPSGADLDLHRDFEQEFCDSFFTTKDPAPDNVRTFLARHGVVTSNKIKVEEFCIKPKNALFILGTLAENPGIEITPDPIRDADPVNSFSSQGFSLTLGSVSFSSNRNEGVAPGPPLSQLTMRHSQAAPEIIPLSAHSSTTKSSEMTQQQKIAAALIKAGISNPVAWSAAGISAPGMAASGVQVMTDPAAAESGNGPNGNSQTGDFDSHPPVVLMKGTNNKTFLISWRSQQEIARAMGWKCALMIWGGPVLALLGLYVLLNTTKVIH
ncbi:MAG TPA: hypothetical protein VGS05_17510 [Candidatus Sulfotelmatobacter sp.]|nr:hypothetical protein [Candidatus Sulfotelmatobacter sp.]